MLMHLRPEVTQAQDITEEAIIPLGPPEPIREILRAVWPGVELREDGYGFFGGRDFGIEFSLARDPVDFFTLWVRGSGTNALDAIRLLCEHLDCRALDTTTGDFINFDRDAGAGFRRWQTYRNAALADLRERGELASEPDDEDGGEKQ